MGLRNILIVEDDPFFALDLTDLVFDAGCNPIGPAHCYQGALELASQYDIDLAIIDVHLSDGATGVDLARLLAERHGIRTVIVSGSIPPPGALPGTEHVFVRKPVPTEILSRIMTMPVDRQIRVA